MQQKIFSIFTLNVASKHDTSNYLDRSYNFVRACSVYKILFSVFNQFHLVKAKNDHIYYRAESDTVLMYPVI